MEGEEDIAARICALKREAVQLKREVSSLGVDIGLIDCVLN